MLNAVAAALEQDAGLLSGEERATIDIGIAHLRATAAGSGHLAIKAAIEQLNRATEEFAARRMDRSIRSAFTGRTLDSIGT
jgi:molecular chaperone HscA